jgi:phage-related minor tail protein
MKIEQIMECLLAKINAEIRTNQAKADTALKYMAARLVVMIQNNQEKMMVMSHAHHKRMMARMDSQIEKMEDAVNVFKERLNKMDTTDLEANREMSEVVAEQHDIPKEDDGVKTIGAPKNRYGAGI